MTTSLLAYEEVADFLSELNPQKILNLKPSLSVQERVDLLLQKNQDSQLSSDEKYELDRYLALEHLIALSKVRARKRLKV